MLQTLNIVAAAGAHSRRANIFAGPAVAIGVLLFANAVEMVAMPALAGLVLLAGIQMINMMAIQTVWQVNIISRTVMATIFASTLIMPLQFAVLLGVVISILLFVLQQSNSEFSNQVMQSLDLLRHLGQIDNPTTIVGLVTIPLMLLGLVLATFLLFIFGWTSVGIAVAIIGLLQGAGISLGYPNPDGKYPDVSPDFVGQGIANVAVSLFQGLPVGGSLSSTALVVSVGAKTRLANIFTGLFAILAVVIFAPLIELLPMFGLAAILVIAWVQSIKLPRIQHVWQTGPASRAIMIFTFIATLIIPIQYAVFLGVLLSFVIHIYQASEKVESTEIVPLPDGRYEERPAPKQLPSNQAILLAPRGSVLCGIRRVRGASAGSRKYRADSRPVAPARPGGYWKHLYACARPLRRQPEILPG